LQAAEEEVEEEDEVTGYSNCDMGLQARALYDYQAGKSLCWCRLYYVDIDSSFMILSNLVFNSVEQNIHQNTLLVQHHSTNRIQTTYSEGTWPSLGFIARF
jgi:hypothetical protein